MQRQPEIDFHGVDLSAAVRDTILLRIEKLERYASDIIGCRVAVEAPHRHADPNHHAVRYEVRIHVELPGDDLHVQGGHGDDSANADINVAIRDSFDTAERLLKKRGARRRREVKHHEQPPVARVVELFPDQDYGFLEDGDGTRIYFHRNAVLGEGYDALTLGSLVHYVDEQGEKGRQASTVRPV